MSWDDSSIVAAVVGGDAGLLATLESWSSERIDAAAARASLTLTPPAVSRVLADLRSGHLDAATAQRWGAAMRWGGYRELGTTSLEVAIEPKSEDAIADALERLDELGDLIDGEFRPGEIDQLLAALRAGG